MTEDHTGEAESFRRPLTRPSTAFERPPGNVYDVPHDGGSPLEDVSQRPVPTLPGTEAAATDLTDLTGDELSLAQLIRSEITAPLESYVNAARAILGSAWASSQTRAVEADRDKYLVAFSQQFEQREEYQDECRRLWPVEERAELAEQRAAAAEQREAAMTAAVLSVCEQWEFNHQWNQCTPAQRKERWPEQAAHASMSRPDASSRAIAQLRACVTAPRDQRPPMSDRGE